MAEIILEHTGKEPSGLSIVAVLIDDVAVPWEVANVEVVVDPADAEEWYRFRRFEVRMKYVPTLKTTITCKNGVTLALRPESVSYRRVPKKQPKESVPPPSIPGDAP